MAAAVDQIDLSPYVAPLAIDWLSEDPTLTFRDVDGTIAFVDISGFTKLSERLSRLGKIGAEELTSAIGRCFDALLTVAYADGASLLKFGGDALLLLFTGDSHAVRAAHAAAGMRAALRHEGRLATSAGKVTLRMSVGVHSGTFASFLVGDRHRELIVTGPAATQTVLMEQAAEAGEIVVGGATARLLPGRNVGSAKGDGFLLRGTPPASEPPAAHGLPPDCSRIAAGAVSEEVCRHLVGGGSEPEHRLTTVVFLRFEGTDAIIEREGAGALADRLNELVANVEESAAGHGVTFLGTDIDRDGGKVILVAGAPRATGADEESALLAARAIVDAAPPLPVRIGMNRGYVFAGDIGPAYRRTYTVMGDTVNLAARLMAAASPGSILATPGVLERSRTRFAVSALPPFTVKGKSKPVEAYSVESPIVDRGTDPVALLPLVGRADEMTTLASALEALASGRGAVVEIVSEAGLGRTRIAEELRSRAGTTQLAWTNGGPYAAGTPYFPFRSLLSDVLGIGAGEPVSVARALEDLAAAEAPEVLPWLPLVGLVLNVAVQSTPETDALDPSFRRAQLERAVVDLVSAHVRAPAVFVFEDVHFFDDASAGLLEALGVAALDRPWLVVSTRSEGWRANTRALSGATLLALEPLRRDDARQLAEVAAGSAALSDHDLDAIANRSGGNPLVIRELVAAVAGKEDVEGLPETVEALMTARIDRLPPRDRILLRTASVLGTVFDAPMLAGLLDEGCPDPGDPVWTRLARYVRGQGGVYRFASPIIRDVAYEGLTYRARKTLHERAGETMLRSGENDRIEVLALHFSSAGRHPEAWRFGREAGDRARSKYAHIEAARFFERALASARRLEVPSSDVAATHESLGDALAAAGEFRRAERSYADGRHIAATDVPTAVRLLMKEAQIADRLGRFTLSLRRLTRGQHALGAAPSEEAARLRPKLSMWYAAVLQQQGRHREAIRWCTKTLEEAGAVDDRHALAYAHQILDWALASVGEDAGHEHLRIALELYEEIGDLKGQAVALNNLGAAEYFAGRWDAAVELYERSRSAHERIGDPVGATMGMVNVAEIMSDQGRLDEAEPLLVRALRIGKASGHRVGAAFAMGQLARVAARAGRFDDAFALFKDVESEYLDLGDAASVTETRARIAESWVLAGDPDRALAALDEIGLPESGPSSSLRPLQLRTRGVALAQTGDFDGGRAALVASIEAARSHGSDHEEAIAAHWLARLAESQGSRDGDAARRSEEIFTRLHVVRAPDPPLHRLE